MDDTEKKQSSLFVGRWQPFHKGHKTLIETVLKKGKAVVVAIRDTDISHSNPYTLHERWSMIQRELHEYGDLVKIVAIPDIDEICYGRDVGYVVRKINLDGEIESISGTKTREKNPPTKEIIWLTGNSGAGKTTLANILEREIGAVVLDGDEMRESISIGASYSQKDRDEHNVRVARLAKVLAKRTPVIVSVIAPFEKTREKIDTMIRPIWVHVKRTLPLDKEKPYEVPKEPHIIVDSDNQSPEENAKFILDYLAQRQDTKK